VYVGTAGANAGHVDTASLQASITPSMELSSDFQGAEPGDTARVLYGSIDPTAGGLEGKTRSTVRTTPVSAPKSTHDPLRAP
jgi:hypothetical protein